MARSTKIFSTCKCFNILPFLTHFKKFGQLISLGQVSFKIYVQVLFDLFVGEVNFNISAHKM